MENSLYIPKGYSPRLDAYKTQRAIEFIKKTFESEFSSAMNLKRVSAPLFVEGSSGLNDDLNGVERPVSFDIPAISCPDAQVVHSLAKWKRLALKKYGFSLGKGLYTDMNAIRRDEALDNLHSVYVDQWDWEKVISAEMRNTEYLKSTVQIIVDAVCRTSAALRESFPEIDIKPSPNITFVSTRELESLYPDLSPAQREKEFVKDHNTLCLMQIGAPLSNGKPHDGRAPDYDDWELNCDIIFYSELLERPIEISSMGIRVDKNSLAKQLKAASAEERAKLPFHKMLLNDELPLTIGGGIGQSRLCMYLMGCAHIGQVQCSIWDENTVRECEKAGIRLL